jgi:hypothetical protein
MDFDLAVDAYLVLETSVRFGNDGRKTPGAADFDLLDEVDAVGVLGCVFVGESRHEQHPPLGPLGYQSGHQTGHQGVMLLIPKVAG